MCEMAVVSGGDSQFFVFPPLCLLCKPTQYIQYLPLSTLPGQVLPRDTKGAERHINRAHLLNQTHMQKEIQQVLFGLSGLDLGL